MRYVAIALALAVGACGPRQMDALTYSHEMYIGCLRMKEPAECETQRAAFEANKGYADSVSQRRAATPVPVPVFSGYQPVPPVQSAPISCYRTGNITNCY